MSKILIVYDNCIEVPYEILDIIGNRSFSQIMKMKKKLIDGFVDQLNSINFEYELIELNTSKDINEMVVLLEGSTTTQKVAYIYSNYAVKKPDEFEILMRKTEFVTQQTNVKSDEVFLRMFPSVKMFLEFYSNTNEFNEYQVPVINSDAMYNLKDVNQMIQFLSSGFDARYFNRLNGDAYSIIKSSSNKDKIQREYEFYHLLPDDMKPWFVLPYDYKVDKDIASYTMQRFHMTDVAIKWIHNAMSIDEFEDFLEGIIRFIKMRHTKEVTKEVYNQVSHQLFVEKVEERVATLKAMDGFSGIEKLVSNNTKYKSLEAIVDRYKELYSQHVKGAKDVYYLAIGHGDPCFSNILYNKDLRLIKLIDPKGALTKDELWTHPYYDIAKLSHSICGHYDYINNGLYQITLNPDMEMVLELEEKEQQYRQLFLEKISDIGFDRAYVRLYETSLFLSMLPLHMDNPQKVFALILNAINIIDEVETYEFK